MDRSPKGITAAKFGENLLDKRPELRQLTVNDGTLGKVREFRGTKAEQLEYELQMRQKSINLAE
jgi:hypothetical protein